MQTLACDINTEIPSTKVNPKGLSAVFGHAMFQPISYKLSFNQGIDP